MNTTCKVLDGSWYKVGKENDLLLEHEIGHLIIGHIFSYKFQSLIHNKLFTNENIDNNIRSIFNTIFDECVNHQKLYDYETDHSLEKLNQDKWNQNLKDEFNKIQLLIRNV